MTHRIIQHLQSAAQIEDKFNTFRDVLLSSEGNKNYHKLLLKQIYHNLGSDALNMIVNSDCQWLLANPSPENKVLCLFICM